MGEIRSEMGEWIAMRPDIRADNPFVIGLIDDLSFDFWYLCLRMDADA